jgi:CO dehydrogenase/acetyl-CoA synthase beta subunit
MRMDLFERNLDAVLFALQKLREDGKVTDSLKRKNVGWPPAGDGDIVLGADTAVELGHPKEGSTAFILWTHTPERLQNKRISLIGPDLRELRGKRKPFGKMVLLGVEAFDADNSYERYRKLENVRYDIRLKGYMMRAVSQHGREWSRVSRTALDDGFSLLILGGALMDRYLEFDFVRSVEIVFLTSGREDMKPFLPIADNTLKIIAAMNKMIEEVSFDCAECEYSDVCGDVEALRAMRRSLQERREPSDA